MQYNLYIKTGLRTYNIFGSSEAQVAKVVLSYLDGEPDVTLTGKKYFLSEMIELKIFTYEIGEPLDKSVNYYLNNIHFRKQRKGQNGFFLPATTLSKMGKNVTNSFLGDAEYGQNAKRSVLPIQITSPFVSESRLNQLSLLSQNNFDLKRLIQLCEEINSNYSSNNFLSVGMIGRTIINHVPPILGFQTFEQVAANYGGPDEHRSFKKNMKHLNESLKNISDGILHQTIRKKEVLPNEIQIDFRQDLDVLLGEIVRVLR